MSKQTDNHSMHIDLSIETRDSRSNSYGCLLRTVARLLAVAMLLMLSLQPTIIPLANARRGTVVYFQFILNESI